jgi:hypothetical protein
MQVNYTFDALHTLAELVNYIESKNTLGAGNRWLNKYELFLQLQLRYPDKISLCNNLTFQQLQLRCIHFNDWVIAFSIHPNKILIEALLHKSRIAD